MGTNLAELGLNHDGCDTGMKEDKGYVVGLSLVDVLVADGNS